MGGCVCVWVCVWVCVRVCVCVCLCDAVWGKGNACTCMEETTLCTFELLRGQFDGHTM